MNTVLVSENPPHLTADSAADLDQHYDLIAALLNRSDDFKLDVAVASVLSLLAALEASRTVPASFNLRRQE